jgi:SAM-dependent methyltransferase
VSTEEERRGHDVAQRKIVMSGLAKSDAIPTEAGAGRSSQYYKRDVWSEENLKFDEPWYRLEKSTRLITKLARGKECSLLDIGCGPATMGRMLPPNIKYYGIDIAIHHPAPNLIEADLVEAPIRFRDERFDIVIAQGVFEYLGEFQSQKFAEISQVLNETGTFIVTYTNFGHRKPRIYGLFSNVQPISAFRDNLAQFFKIEKSFPASHNWKHDQPNRPLVKALNMRVNANIPVLSRVLGVEYFFICSSH